jgi:hypothetical protein
MTTNVSFIWSIDGTYRQPIRIIQENTSWIKQYYHFRRRQLVLESGYLATSADKNRLLKCLT